MFRPNISLRLQLLIAFVLCLAIAFIIFFLLDFITRDIRTENYQSYESSKKEVHYQLEFIEKRLPQLAKQQELVSLLNEVSKKAKGVKVNFTDVTGQVLYHSANSSETSLDIYYIMYQTKETLKSPAPGKLYAEVTPVKYNGKNLYLVVASNLYAEPGVNYRSSPVINSIVYVTIFSILFYLFTFKKMRQIQDINNTVQDIANGNLLVRLPVTSGDELGTLSDNVNGMVQQLKEKIARERAVEKSKIDLITNISHDLRTPLTSIIGYLTLLKEKNYQTPDEKEHYITSSYNKAEQLKKLIDDLFEYTRLTSGDIQLDKHSIDLHQMLEQMVVEFEPIAISYNITLQNSLGGETVLAIVDPDRIARALDNLLVNALKFSIKPGNIKVSLRKEDEWAILAVSNKGLPMTEEQANLVFERFYRANNTVNNGGMVKGAGLGLAIAKNIVELHSGQIWLEHKGNYYEFIIKLPTLCSEV